MNDCEALMDTLLQLDGNFLLWIQDNFRQDFMDGFWIFITSLGNAGWFWIALSILLVIFPTTRKAGITALLSLLLCALITNVCLKNLVARPRPYTQLPDLTLLIAKPADWSFPSGHTTASLAAAYCYYRMLPKKLYGILALILAALIAFSRLYVGAHYPSDILGGLIVGIFGSWLVCRLYLMWEQKRTKTIV